jgi:hypothetical protein
LINGFTILKNNEKVQKDDSNSLWMVATLRLKGLSSEPTPECVVATVKKLRR